MERQYLGSEFVDIKKEEALLAAIIANPQEVYFAVADMLNANVFTAERKEVYKNVEFAILNEKSLPEQTFGEISQNPESTANDLLELFEKRVTTDALEEAFLEIRNTAAHEIISKLESRMADIQQSVRAIQAGAAYSIRDIIDSVLVEAQEIADVRKINGNVIVGLPTGFPRLDTLLGGLQSGIHMLAAEPNIGKTTLTLQIAGHVAKCGVPALFVTYEEPRKRLALKSICQAAALKMKEYQEGFGDIAKLKQAIQIHGSDLAPVYIVEGTAKTNIASIKAKALQVMNKHKTKKCLIIIDYLQKMASMRREGLEFRHNISGLVADFQELSKRLDSPILLISSQNRTGQGSANFTSLKDCGDLEYDGDSIWFLTKDDKRTITPLDKALNITLTKNRFGEKDVKIEVNFKGDIGRIRESDKRYKE